MAQAHAANRGVSTFGQTSPRRERNSSDPDVLPRDHVDVPRVHVSAMNKDAAAAETVRPDTTENRWRREKGLFPQPEFRLVTMDGGPLARRPADEESGSDPMTEFGA
jgi:hypothetical protein